MSAIRVRVAADADGELHLRGLPIRRGEEADVIVLTGDLDEPTTDEMTLAILKHDPSWAWIHDTAEDQYTEDDILPNPGRSGCPREAELVLARFPFTDGTASKLRPVLVLAEIAGSHDDCLVMFVSSQLRVATPGVDVVLDRSHPEFARSGLKVPSVFRVGKVAAISNDLILGPIGAIASPLFDRIVNHLVRLIEGR